MSSPFHSPDDFDLRKRKFMASLARWVLLSLFLFGINIYSSPGYLWAIFPFLGIGLGVGMEAVKLFIYDEREDPSSKAYQKAQRKAERKALKSPKAQDELDLRELEKRPRSGYDDQELV